MKYLIEDLNFQYQELSENIFLHAASFYYTTPDAFQYLVDKIENSHELLHKLDEEGRNAADIASKNTELYKFLTTKLKVYPEKNETVNYRNTAGSVRSRGVIH